MDPPSPGRSAATAYDGVALRSPRRFFCADGSSSSSATLFYNSLPGAVKHLFHSGYMFPQVPRRTRSSCHARACECKRFVRACLWLCARRVSRTVPWVRVMRSMCSRVFYGRSI